MLVVACLEQPARGVSNWGNYLNARKLQKLNVPKQSLFFNAEKNTLHLFHDLETCIILQFRYSTMFSSFNLVHIVLFFK